MATLSYRPLVLKDKPGMQVVCKECFPVDYPDKWYDNVLRKRDFYTLGAFDEEELVGMIVGQTQDLLEAEDEIGTLLESLINNDKAMYIVIFGVLERYRRLGVGSVLMDDLIKYATSLKSVGQSNGSPVSNTGKSDKDQLDISIPMTEKDRLINNIDQSNTCTANHTAQSSTTRVIYLHVESTNNVAITFYEKKRFSYFSTIYEYYRFENNNSADGLVYVMCINNGRLYQGGLRNWCRRYFVSSISIMNCFKEACEGTIELVKNAFNT